MRKYRTLLLACAFAFSGKAQTFVNGQAARAVIGQVEFTAALSNAQAYITGAANGVAYANGTLFVADSNKIGDTPSNNRVLMFSTSQIGAPDTDISNIAWPDTSCHVCGYAAENVLGQPDFSSTNPGTANAPYPSNGLTAGWMQTPTAVATDGHILAVADTDNNRILIWKSIPTVIDQPADLVLGQTSFTTSTSSATPTASSLRGPQGVWIQNGKLFVADTQNYRVLIWNSIPTSNNQPADVVLGQTNFSSGSQSACDPTKAVQTATASELCTPASVTADNTHVFVADLGFNRVLIWNSIPTQNGQPANVVVGQLDMTTTAPNNSYKVCYSNGVDSNGDTYPTECASTLSFPQFALSDGTRLFIADGGNDRVLIFNSIPTGNGALANEVLGQPDFVSDVETSNTQTVASTAIDNTSAVDVIPTPTSLAYDGTNLYVSDPTDRRVLVFTPGNTQLPDNSILNWASEIIRQEGVISLAGTIVANDTVTVTIASTNYTYTIKSTDSLDTVAQGLVSVINANSGDPNVTAIFAGVGTGSVYLSSKATNLGFDAISLAVTTSNPADITATASGEYLSAGTGATAAPGMLVEIDGSNLSDQPSGSPVVAPLSGSLPATLGGAQVYMDGLASPLMSVSSTQIVAQVPYTFTDRSSASVYVRTVHQDGAVTVTNATPVYIAPANPGLFNAPSYLNQPRPWPASGALHQSGNPTAVVSIDGTATAGDQSTITVNGRTYTYTEVSGDTLESVVNGLVKLINGIDPQVTAAPGAAFNRVVLTAIQSGAAGTGIPISGASSTSATVTVTAYTSSTCCAVTPGTLITPSNPAVAGELITVTATGLGTLEDVNGNELPFPATGTPYEGAQPNTAGNSVSATINGQTAEVVSAGLPQGSYGVYQVQLIVPSGFATTSAAQLYIAQNAFISNIATIPVGAAVMVTPPPPPKPSPIRISIDTPSVGGGSLVGVTHIAGWAFDSNAVITSVKILVDGVAYGVVQETGARQDVCNAFQSPPGCPDLGWNYLLDTTQIANGAHTLQVTAYAADGLNMTVSTPVYVANPTKDLPTSLFIDHPSVRDGAYQGVVTFSGWAFNGNGPINSVALTVDGIPVGQAPYGAQSSRGNRPDVCAVYPGKPGCPYVGWSLLLDTGTLTNGSHTLSVLATGPDGQHVATSSSFTVSNWSTANPMTVDIDNPSSQSAAFRGTVGFGGWAVDINAPVSTIQVSVDGVSYGKASYGGYRPDVCQVLAGRPGCPYVGWNFPIDTTRLADGAHTLAITGTTAAGQSSTAATSFTVANFTASNPMQVHIDRPSPQSGPFSGSAAFGGWAISTNSAISTVQILVDGAIKGMATPGTRSDVCAAFPDAKGCPNVGWNFLLDTTLLTNGSHTLQVMAISASGERGTAGESFTVRNSAPNGPTWAFIDQPSGRSNPFLGLALFSGWALDANAPIGTVAVSVDGVPLGNADYGVNSAKGSRADVCATYSGVGCPNVGWSFLVDTTLLSDGAHSLGIEVTAGDGSHVGVSSLFIVANWVSGPNPMTVNIDTPSFLSTPFSGADVQFGGWAVDTVARITGISISVDGIPFGDASYGGARADVCAVYPGAPGCPDLGWNVLLDTTLLPNGNHTLGVTAISSTGQSSTATAGFSVAN